MRAIRLEHGDGAARVAFRDRIRLGERRLDFRCEQRVRLNEAGQIVHIQHIDLPGERDKAKRFNEACGLKKPDN